MNYFFLDTSPWSDKYILRPLIEVMPFPHGTTGSYMLIAARVMNMDYVDYLRFCRDQLGAELNGRNKKYVTVYFDKTPEVEAFVKLLNTRMEYIMEEQRNPYTYKEVNGKVEREPINMGD